MDQVREGSDTVLACIVRVTAGPAGEWSLGCVFSCELEEDELQQLGGRREKHAASDQRTGMRFLSQVEAVFQPLGAQPLGSPDPDRHPAQVLNISASGMGLLVPSAIETGTLLSIDLSPPAGSFRRTMLACVVHATSHSPGQWALGCNFIHELDEDDLQALAAT